MGLFLGNEQLLDTNYQVEITLNEFGKPPTVVRGNIQSEFSIGGRNEFGKGLDIAGAAGLVSGGAARAIASATKAVSGALRTIRGRDVVPVWETEAVWGGGGKPVFDLELTFLCVSTKPSEAQTYSVTRRVNALMRAVYPDLDAKGIRTFRPPLGYTRSDSVGGKIDLKIGNWFFARKLVCEAASFEYSREVNRLGQPLFAKGRVTLTPYRSISYREFLKYFVG
jgi:hypothetical protein